MTNSFITKTACLVCVSYLALMTSAKADGLTDATLKSVNNHATYQKLSNGLKININNGSVTLVKWDKLNVGKNEQLQFNFARNNATALNQVAYGNASTIAGQIKAIGNGAGSSNIVISNPSGVIFNNGATFSVNNLSVMSKDGDIIINKAVFNQGNLDLFSENGNVKVAYITLPDDGSLTAAAPQGEMKIAGNITVGKNFAAMGDSINLNAATVVTKNGKFTLDLSNKNGSISATKSNVAAVEIDAPKANLNLNGNIKFVLNDSKLATLNASGKFAVNNSKIDEVTSVNANGTIDNSKIGLLSSNKADVYHIADSKIDDVTLNGTYTFSLNNVKLKNDVNIISAGTINLENTNFNAYGDLAATKKNAIANGVNMANSKLVLRNIGMNNSLVAKNSQIDLQDVRISHDFLLNNVDINLSGSNLFNRDIYIKKADNEDITYQEIATLKSYMSKTKKDVKLYAGNNEYVASRIPEMKLENSFAYYWGSIAPENPAMPEPVTTVQKADDGINMQQVHKAVADRMKNEHADMGRYGNGQKNLKVEGLNATHAPVEKIDGGFKITHNIIPEVKI